MKYAWKLYYILWVSVYNHFTFGMMTSSNGNIFRVTGRLCEEFTGDRWFPSQRPVTRSFDIFFDLRLNKRLSKQSWGWWFKTPSHPLWRHCNGNYHMFQHHLYAKSTSHVVPLKHTATKTLGGGYAGFEVWKTVTQIKVLIANKLLLKWCCW